METSRLVLEALDQSRTLSGWISEHHPQGFTHDGTNMLAAAFFSIAAEHREAILCLLRHGARTSAFALARSVYEAVVRGYWARCCATKDQYDRAFEKGILPNLDPMVKALGKVPDTAGVFRRMKDMAYDPLSDYAHGGMRQVKRWIGPEGVAPQHSDLEVLDLIAFVDVQALNACAGLAVICGGDSEAHAAKVSEVLAAFKARKAAHRSAHP